MRYLLTIAILGTFIGKVLSQELAFESPILDTNIYSYSYNGIPICQDLDQAKSYAVFMPGIMMSETYYNKTTGQIDVFIQQTKTVSIKIPTTPKNTSRLQGRLISKTIFNNDTDWETLWIWVDTVDNYQKAFLSTSSGSIIWSTLTNERVSDGSLIYFDGTYTYLKTFVLNDSNENYRYYRFHPSLSSTNPSLSKTTSSSNFPIPLISFSASGDFRIKLVQSPAGATTISIFNLLGQQFFSHTFTDLKKDVTFTVPSRSLPGSPIIMRVQNNQGVSLTRSIPVK